MQTFSPAQQQRVQDIEAVIRARLTPHASQIIEEALNSTSIALPRGLVAAIILGITRPAPQESA